jgi:hypothetical protein
MYKTREVRSVERAQDLFEPTEHEFEVRGAEAATARLSLSDPFRQGDARHIGLDQIRNAVDRADLECTTDAGMLQPRRRHHFVGEAASGLLVEQLSMPQDLDHHLAAIPRVGGEVYFGHATTESLHEFEPAEGGRRHGGHRGRQFAGEQGHPTLQCLLVGGVQCTHGTQRLGALIRGQLEELIEQFLKQRFDRRRRTRRGLLGTQVHPFTVPIATTSVKVANEPSRWDCQWSSAVSPRGRATARQSGGFPPNHGRQPDDNQRNGSRHSCATNS